MNSLNINVEILRIKTIGLDRRKSYSERKIAIDQLTRLPHKDKNIHITDCLLAMMSDDKIPIEYRYSLFCENRSFDNDVQKKCHLFYFNNFNPPRYPIRFKLMSAQYLLQTLNKDQFDLREVYGYLIRLCKSSEDKAIKDECSDILFRCGYKDSEIFEELAAPVVFHE